MKTYAITEKQLDELKRLIEKFEQLPENICSHFYADYVEPINGAISEYQYQNTKTNALVEPAEHLRELKYFVEDVEKQEEKER